MKVLCAKSAGFCLGVSLALKKLDQALKEQNKDVAGRLVVFGAIIHNPLVMQHYENLGVLCLENPEDILPEDRVVIRAHGIPFELEEAIRSRGAFVIDATCPKVKKAQVIIAKASARGGSLLLFGEREHPEVKGLVSYAKHDAIVFACVEEINRIELDKRKKYFLAAQTTQDKKIFQQIAELIQKRLPYKLAVLPTICDATKERQDEVLAMVGQVQAMVVVGGLNSGNTTRLAELARSGQIPTLHVEKATDMDLSILKNVDVVGLTAGASTPDAHIEEVRAVLEKL